MLHRSGRTVTNMTQPVGLKWIDTNKGSAEAPRYRSRLVCTEVRHEGVEPIFSATFLLETLRILLIVACHEDVFWVEDALLISIADVSRAHFYADADCQTRTPRQSSQECVGNCERQCTGSLDATQRWEEHYAQVLETGGFSRGVASPYHFFHKDLETYMLVHGDDFFIVGRQCTEFAARCIRAEQSGKSEPRPSQSRTASF